MLYDVITQMSIAKIKPGVTGMDTLPSAEGHTSCNICKHTHAGKSTLVCYLWKDLGPETNPSATSSGERPDQYEVCVQNLPEKIKFSTT